MINGTIATTAWQTNSVQGEEPESCFCNDRLQLFFYGTLYNRDTLLNSLADNSAVDASCSNAGLIATLYQTVCDRENVSGSAVFLLRKVFSGLDGSFTIVLYSDKLSALVRDHHGTHYPLYYTLKGRFSTSWQELGGETPFVPYTVSLSTFLQRGILPSGYSVAGDSVRTLPAGTALLMDSRDAFSRPLRIFLHEPRIVKNSRPDVESLSRRYGELHVKAIRRRISGSRRVGILLSGGYDSGANLAALRSIYDGPIDSYSIGFKGDAWTELPLARIMSETFGTRHHEYEIDGSEILQLPHIVRFLGEPFVEGGLMVNYCAMRMIGEEKPDVILGGDGSDQYFGTSGREVALHYLAARTGVRPLMRGVNRLLEHERFDTGGKLSRIRFHLDKVLNLMEGDRFGFTDRALNALLQRPYYDYYPFSLETDIPDVRSYAHLYNQHALVSDLEVVIDRIILFKASRMAQLFGNNLTYPFMDLDLYHFLQSLPVSLKCKGSSLWGIARGRSQGKYLLKHHYTPLLPPEITQRKKQGGFAPMPLFFSDGRRRACFREFILSCSGIYSNYLSRPAVEQFLNDYDKLADTSSGNIWFWHRQNKALQYCNLLTLAVWWEEFVEGRHVDFECVL